MNAVTAAGSVGAIVLPFLTEGIPNFVVLIIGAVSALFCGIASLWLKSSGSVAEPHPTVAEYVELPNVGVTASDGSST
jgi:hypothetical protein